MKSTKILVALILASAIISLNSCKKDKKAIVTVASITANIDGTATAFNVNAKAVKSVAGTTAITTIGGTAADGTKFTISLNGTITSGKTFSALSGTSDDEPLILLIASDNAYLNDDSSAATLSSVTITSVSSSSIQGAFNAHLISTGLTSSAKSVTDGKFNVSF